MDSENVAPDVNLVDLEDNEVSQLLATIDNSALEQWLDENLSRLTAKKMTDAEVVTLLDDGNCIFPD